MTEATQEDGRPWFVYVLRSQTIYRSYVGIATDVERRLEQHNGVIPGGAKSTRAGRPWKVAVVYGAFEDRSEASKVEYRVKKRRGEQRFNADFPRIDLKKNLTSDEEIKQ